MTEFRNFLTDFGNLLIVIRANEKLSVEDMAEKIELEKIMLSCHFLFFMSFKFNIHYFATHFFLILNSTLLLSQFSCPLWHGAQKLACKNTISFASLSTSAILLSFFHMVICLFVCLNRQKFCNGHIPSTNF